MLTKKQITILKRLTNVKNAKGKKVCYVQEDPNRNGFIISNSYMLYNIRGQSLPPELADVPKRDDLYSTQLGSIDKILRVSNPVAETVDMENVKTNGSKKIILLQGNFGVNKQYLKWAFDYFRMDYVYVDWALTKDNPLPIIYVMKDNSYAAIMPCRINTEKGN